MDALRRSTLVPADPVLLSAAAARRATVPLVAPVAGRGPRPLVLAHRGATGPQRRDNTVRAVEAALRAGADGVEVDVRLTADGHLACSHDAVVRDAQGRALTVGEQPLAALRRAVARTGGRLATLEEVLDGMAHHATARLVVEVKPAADPVRASRTVTVLEGVLADARTEVVVSSFDDRVLRLVRRVLGDRVRGTALLSPARVPAHEALRRALDAGHQELHVSLAALQRAPHALRLAHQLGVSVIAWTVNATADVRRLAAWGVDGLITDNVAVTRHALAGARTVVGSGASVC